jgi:hypothetical protein
MKTATILCLLALAAPLVAGEKTKKNNPRTPVFTAYFEAADTDGDGYLSAAEFDGTVGAGKTVALTRYRFNFMARGFWLAQVRGFEEDGDVIAIKGEIPLSTYIRYAGGLRVPAPQRYDIFAFADFDRDGFLDLSEFAATRNTASATNGNVAKAFGKMDKNDDDQISREEFGVEFD